MGIESDREHLEGERLRILVCPHELVVGGSQMNAIDIAASLRDRGHVVRVFAPAAALVDRIRDHGLDYVDAPARSRGFDLRGARAMSRQIRDFRPDVVHAFESYPTIASALAWFRRPHRSVVTMMSMSIPDYIPSDVTLTAGTQSLVDGVHARTGVTTLLEPPIDAELDTPADMATSRASLGITDDETVVAVVGRLSAEHQKARGIVSAIDELSANGGDMPLTLLVAGAGDEEGDVRKAVARLKSDGGLQVRLLGNVPDPRPVYSSADIVFGMGGSALRAMAHAKPLIVQGADGFWAPLAPETLPIFQAQGFFGDGPTGGPSFTELVRELVQEPGRRDALGQFGRDVVLERYSLAQATRRLEGLYRDEISATRPYARTAKARVGALARFAKFRLALRFPGLQRTFRSLRGRNG